MLDKAKKIFKVRDDEPDYAFIPDVDVPGQNLWGKNIQTVAENAELTGKSLHINNNPDVGTNPNRYKQHGFHFTADNCIGCHACEAACSEKNDLPAHLSYRSVGYVEGGTYPAYKRLNISMACNHCDDPVCLKGCPTRAYTKFAEYGAVLQDPDICFGCGYCTWVCPYNAPQLDPVKGQVSKCNMCVDRLEVGLKPACAAACLGGALEFGLIESKPENREQAKIQIPGFPTPDITHPNIRFQQSKSLPREMTRPDTMPIRYQRDDQGQGEYKVKASLKKTEKHWSLKKLRSREDPLVQFTLITQGVIGAFTIMFLATFVDYSPIATEYPLSFSMLLFALLGIMTYGLFVSTMHLGKPHRFYRAFNNLKYSPVSREVAAVAVFFNLMAGYSVLHTFPVLVSWLPTEIANMLVAVCGWGAVLTGPVALYAMHKIYRIKARPFWNHWQVLSSFYGNMFTLGSMAVALTFCTATYLAGNSYEEVLQLLLWPMGLGLVLEMVGLYFHSRDLLREGGEAVAAMQEQSSTFGKTYISRNLGLLLSTIIIAILGFSSADGLSGLVLLYLGSLLIMSTALIGRALFYVLVIPTTMPGAFFWRNKGFQEHARETGLADMPQVGVIPDSH